MSIKTELEALITSLGAPSEFRRMHLGLERITALCRFLGNPQENFKVIQVVGTNGKGSTTFYLSQMLHLGLGLKVGSFYSPHLLCFNERIRVDGKPVSDELLLATLQKVVALGHKLDEEPTFFEVVTAAALDIFAAAGVEIAVLEAGLGGRLDATTVAEAKWGLVTEVGLDHCHILGDTIPAILQEKLAAFTAAQKVLIGPQSPAADPVLTSLSLSKWCISGRDFTLDDSYENWPVVGRYRRRALALAAEMSQLLAHDLGVALSPLSLTNLEVNFPGRLHVLQQNKPIIADISHNPPAIQEMLLALRELSHDQRPWLVIFGAMQDKDIAAVLNLLKPITGKLFLPELPGSRAAKPQDIIGLLPINHDFAIKTFTSIAESCEAAFQDLSDATFGGLLICGSNFIAGPAIEFFKQKQGESKS